jgi:hypothetical protein
MPFPKAKKEAALKRSLMNTLNASYQNRTAASRMWATAATCPLFLKKATRKPYKMKNGRTSPKYRGNRAISTHTIKAMASGASANASALIEAEAALLRCDTVAETPKYPMLPSVTRSAAMLYEQAIIAYCQTIFAGSRDLKDAFEKKHKKVSIRSTQAAADSLNTRLSEATGFVPPVINAKIKEEKKKPAEA